MYIYIHVMIYMYMYIYMWHVNEHFTSTLTSKFTFTPVGLRPYLHTQFRINTLAISFSSRVAVYNNVFENAQITEGTPKL